MTEWRAHPVFTKYRASASGEICHVESSQPRALRLDRNGYLRFNAWLDGNLHTLKAHSFIFECWSGLIPAGMTIHHKDYDKVNNCLSNMTLMTMAENVGDTFRSENHPRTHPVVISGKRYYSKREAERRTGLSRYEMTAFQAARVS